MSFDIDAVRIADLARLMIRLAGLTERTPDRPEGDIAIEFTGLRPGSSRDSHRRRRD